ncbi:MAG: hypothetical protein WAV54_12450 [Acidimicrobiales bacterium]
MANGISVDLIAPRRYGRTSLIERAARLVREDRGAVISASLMYCAGLDAFAGRLAAGAYTI